MPSLLAFRRACLAALLVLGPSAARAGWAESLLRREVDVITVTDVTEEGRAYPAASPATPVRYKLIYLGETDFGPSWAGEVKPDRKAALHWIHAALKSRGYLLADEQHPPEILCVFGWGMIEGRPGGALGFLGGDRVNLMWENEVQYGGFLNPNVLRRGMMRTGIAGKVWDFASSNLFLGVVRAFSADSETAPKVTQLWETRFACPSNGLWFKDALPVMIKAAAENFGVRTDKPVWLNASEAFGGRVEFGELNILGQGSDLSLPPAKEEPRR